MTQTSEQAEAIALKALAFLVADEDLLPIFFGSSGSSVDDLKSGATDAAFLGSVLDFILMDDKWVIQFCDAQNVDCADVFPARQSLPGGEQYNWT
jgi:hypothetical protein